MFSHRKRKDIEDSPSNNIFIPTAVESLDLPVKTLAEYLQECNLEPSLCDCLQTLTLSQFDMLDTSNYGKWFDADSVMQLAQAGIYHGTHAIQEYVEFLDSSSPIFSQKIGLIHDIIPIPESVSYDQSSRICKATFVIDACSSLSTRVAGGSGSIDHTGMYHLNYKIENKPELLNPTSASIKIKRANIFSPTHYLEHLFTLSHTEEVASEICTIMKSNCANTFDANFPLEQEVEEETDSRHESCIQAMMELKTIDEGGHFDGNSFACRVLHAAMAANNPLHCEHISLLPMKDSNGKVKCQQSLNIAPEDLFEADDFKALHRSAVEQFKYDPADRMFKHNQESCAQIHPTRYQKIDRSPEYLSLATVILFLVLPSLSILWISVKRLSHREKIHNFNTKNNHESDEEATICSSSTSSNSSSTFENPKNGINDGKEVSEQYINQSCTLSWTNVSCCYKNGNQLTTVLSDASGSLAPGNLMSIMGPSGGGKTTLLSIISGMYRHRGTCGAIGGQLSFFGKQLSLTDYNEKNFIRKNSVYIPQEVDFLHPLQTPVEAVQFVNNLVYGNSNDSKGNGVESTLTAVGLAPEVFHRPIGNLSGGQKKKLALAWALVQDPKVLFMDEITRLVILPEVVVVLSFINSITHHLFLFEWSI